MHFTPETFHRFAGNKSKTLGNNTPEKELHFFGNFRNAQLMPPHSPDRKEH
jgi:hypothetical protein